MKTLLKFLVMLFDIVLASIVLYYKIPYYTVEKQVGPGQFFPNHTQALLWIGISIFISLSPLIAQLILINISPIASLATSGSLLACTFCLEVLSVLGATMSLDDSWMNMALTMLKIQAFFLIPLAVNLCIYLLGARKATPHLNE